MHKFCNNDDQYPIYTYNLDCAIRQSSRGRDSSGVHHMYIAYSEPPGIAYVEPVVQCRKQGFNIGNHSHSI